MKAKNSHSARIRSDLMKAGITSWGLLKMESRYLPKILHQDETVHAIAYGRYKEGSAMLVATNRRVLFVDSKPFFNSVDEITYDMVAGVAVNNQALFSSVTLHTRVKNFQLNFVNPRVAGKFEAYIEKRRVDAPGEEPTAAPKSEDPAHQPLDSDGRNFLKSHRTTVLSTASKTGRVHGAVVYYTLVGNKDTIYILTKAETEKAKHILASPNVALTIFDEQNLQTLQIDGKARIETDEKLKNKVFTAIMKPRWIKNEQHLPPVAELDKGMFVVLAISVVNAKYSDFLASHR